MSDKFDIIPASNPIDKERKSPPGVLAFNMKGQKKKDPVAEAVKVMVMDETGASRDERRQEVLNYFPDNSPQGAKVVENIVNKTTGFNKNQLSSLLNHIRLKDFRDSENFIDTLTNEVEKTWLEDI